MTDEYLHELAREYAKKLNGPDKKQLRFNEIVNVAKKYYGPRPDLGVKELVESCDKNCNDLYVAKQPMWSSFPDKVYLSDGG